MASKDFLDELVRERTEKNPAFPRLVEEAAARRVLAQKLVRYREAMNLSQTVVAAQMRTSASVVSKLEGGADVKLSTLQRYLAAVGARWSLVADSGGTAKVARPGGTAKVARASRPAKRTARAKAATSGRSKKRPKRAERQHASGGRSASS